jgi:hypothetical protein
MKKTLEQKKKNHLELAFFAKNSGLKNATNEQLFEAFKIHKKQKYFKIK